MSAELEQDLAALRRAQAAHIAYLRPAQAAAADTGKETVMLLHGISGGAASWYYQLKALAAQFDVIAWDAPGYGESRALGKAQPDPADYARVLADFCHALSLPAVHLVGQSMGALIAAAFSRQYTQQVKSLTLLNPAPGYADEEDSARRRRLDQRVRQMSELGPAGLAAQRSALQLSPNAPADALFLVQWNSRRLHPAGYIQAAHMLVQSSIRQYADYPGPVQVLSGDADTIVPRSSAQQTAQYYPQAQFRTLAGLGHAAYAEGPQQVSRCLRDFFVAPEPA